MPTSNSEYFVGLLKEYPHDEFNRTELLTTGDIRALSPYFTYAVRAELIERTGLRGHYHKTATMAEPLPALIQRVIAAMKKTAASRHPRAAPPPDAPVEVDVHEVLDQLPVEAIFDVLSAKINLLSAQAAPLTHEVAALRNQLVVKEGKIQSLKIEIGRLEDKQRMLNAENTRLTALMTNTKADRLVLAKPLNAAGSAVFRDGEQRTIIVYRKPEGER